MHKEINDTLIWRYLKGELSSLEEAEILEWYNKGKENENLFNSVRLLWIASGNENKIEKSEIDTDFNLICAKIEQHDTQIHQGRIKNLVWTKNWFKYVGSIAASIIILIALTFSGLYFYEIKDNLYTEVNTQRGKQSEIILADGTVVWLNSESSIKYPTKINNKKVDIYLNGEAYFDVAKLKGRDFTVNTGDIRITVQGTMFNVKAYPESGTVEATLEEGKITVTGDKNNNLFLKPVIMNPNQRLVVSLKDKTSQLIDLEEKTNIASNNVSAKRSKHTSNTGTSLYTSWKDGKLQFKNMPFVELEKEMERWFNVNIILNDSVLKQTRYTGVFENESIESALKALSLSLPFDYSLNPDSLIIEPIQTKPDN